MLSQALTPSQLAWLSTWALLPMLLFLRGLYSQTRVLGVIAAWELTGLFNGAVTNSRSSTSSLPRLRVRWEMLRYSSRAGQFLLEHPATSSPKVFSLRLVVG